jgi:hypothetical protein
MSVYFEGNAYIDGGQVQNTVVTLSSIGSCSITTSSLDMNMQNITSVKDPIQPQDAATKKFVENLEITFAVVDLNGQSETLISNTLQGSHVITINNIILNGPTAIFHATKSEASRNAHIIRTVATPGYNSNITLVLSWPQNSGIYLKKTGSIFDGSYRVKIM